MQHNKSLNRNGVRSLPNRGVEYVLHGLPLRMDIYQLTAWTAVKYTSEGYYTALSGYYFQIRVIKPHSAALRFNMGVLGRSRWDRMANKGARLH